MTEEVRYKPPKCELGDIVLWFDGPDGPAHAAVVTRLGTDAICVNILDPDTYNCRIRDGVRHRRDPRARQQDMIDNGCWDHTPHRKWVVEMAKNVERLLRDLGQQQPVRDAELEKADA